LVDLLVDTRAELMELTVTSGLKVLTTMLEEDRTAIGGPRYQHQAGREASRAGTVPSGVVLGGRKVAIRRPRVRRDGWEVPLPTFQLMASEDPPWPVACCSISPGDSRPSLRALWRASEKGSMKR